MHLKSLPKLSDRLKYLREIKQLSQIDLARLAGTTQQAIQQAEAGKARNPRYLHKIAMALDIPYEWLTMNITAAQPSQKQEKAAYGLADEGQEVLRSFYAMPKKDQDLILALMKNRQNKPKK
jgi:transcriptional regulator with XRE-family HTH domain